MRHRDGAGAVGAWRGRRQARAGGGFGFLSGLLLCALVGVLATSAPLAATRSGPQAGPVPETPNFRRMGTAEGLPSSRVNGLAQDRRGYLWIATDDGLVRYDGAGFRTWRAEPGVIGGMPGNNVQTLFVDRDDTVWMGFDDGQIATLDAQRRQVRPPQAARHQHVGLADARLQLGQGADLEEGQGRAARLPAGAALVGDVGEADGRRHQEAASSRNT